MATARIVNCPSCNAPVEWTAASQWRPFCSERCKLLDFGAWANESYRIPAVERDDDEPRQPSAEGDPR